MNCPKCNAKTKVIDTVLNTDHNETYRKRKCLTCGHTFYSAEGEVDYNPQFAREFIANHRAYNRYFARKEELCIEGR